MKPETNNEMDLLLRRLGRSAADSPADADHLDADELSSYAENALPAAARARYTEHLAECASCRKLVAQLSSSAGVVSAAVKVSEPSALRKFLASLFAPMVLRYAVPALGLIVVAVIGFTVLRRDERRDSVAQVAVPEATPVPSQQPESRGFVNDNREPVKSPDATPPTHGERPKEAQPSASQTPGASTTQVAQANEAAPAAPVTKPEQPPPAANTPAEPKPEPATDEEQKKVEIEARKQIANRSVNDLARARSEASKEEDRRADNNYTPSSGAAPRAGSIAKIQRDGTSTADSVREKDKNDDAETRSVAGRRFRRERGVWIDTAYDSSRSIVNVTRGSEQYRALIADEPVIKSIAEQLDGEVIVVWKGRAYRLR
jgi:hypothetical protein